MSGYTAHSHKHGGSSDEQRNCDERVSDGAKRESAAGGPSIEEGDEHLRCYPQPVTHGAGISYNLENTSIYDQARDLWRSEIGEPDAGPLYIPYEPDFIEQERGNSEGFALRFKSSGWKAGTETRTNGYRQWYEYHLTLRERVRSGGGTRWKEPLGISLDIHIQPQSGELVYPDGSNFSLPYGEGTKIWVQTTYPDGPDDMVERSTNALEACFDYGYSGYIPGSARITKLESHVRFDIEAKNRAVECLENSKRLIAYGGSAELSAWQKMTQTGWLEARVDSDRWDLLGFDSAGFGETMKIYQMGDWADRPPEDPLYHPKWEAAYQGGGESHPPLSAWSGLSERLQHKVVQHCWWAGISPDDLVSDPHYLGPSENVGRYRDLEGRRDDLKAIYDDLRLPIISEMDKGTRGPFDILSVVLDHSGADYDTLEAETGLSRSTIRYHVARFEDLGFVERVSNPTWVFFEAPYVEDMVREIVNGWEPDTVARKRIERGKRADERRDARESKSTETDESDEQAARALFRYIEEVGITPDQLSTLIAQGELSERDVRVRWSEELEEKAIG